MIRRAMHGAGRLGPAFWGLVRRIRTGTPGTEAVDAATHAVVASDDLAGALAELEATRAACKRLVTRRATLSAGAAVVPIPLFDLGSDVTILMRLLPAINERFGLTPAEIDSLDPETKRVVLLLVGSVGSSLVGRLITRELVVKILMRMGVRVTTKGIVKFVPLFGQAVSASISFGAMKLLGNRHVDDCYEIARRALVKADTPAADASAT